MRSSPGTEMRMCVPLLWALPRQRCGSLQGTVSSWPRSQGASDVGRATDCGSVGKFPCRPLRNDSSCLPRWGVCLLLPGLCKEGKKEGRTSESLFTLFPRVRGPRKPVARGPAQVQSRRAIGRPLGAWSRALNGRGGWEKISRADILTHLCPSI